MAHARRFLLRQSEGCKFFSLHELVRPRTRQDRRLNLPHWVEITTPGRTSAMFALTRAGFAVATAAALLAVAPFAAKAADKPFQDSDLADSAVQLEGQIKSDAGAATKPVAQIRKDADAAFAKNDFRTGMTLLGQIVAAQPNDATTWLRMARTVMQIRPVNDQERATLLEHDSTADHIAHLRTTHRNEEADSLAFLGDVMSQRQLWRAGLAALAASLAIS